MPHRTSATALDCFALVHMPNVLDSSTAWVVPSRPSLKKEKGNIERAFAPNESQWKCIMRLGTPPCVLATSELQVFHLGVYVTFGRALMRTNFSASTLVPGRVVEIVEILSTKTPDSKRTVVSECTVAGSRDRWRSGDKTEQDVGYQGPEGFFHASPQPRCMVSIRGEPAERA